MPFLPSCRFVPHPEAGRDDRSGRTGPAERAHHLDEDDATEFYSLTSFPDTRGERVSGFDVATWTALGTWALVIGTLILVYWQTRQTQRLNSANAVMTLRERFDSTRMRLARRRLAGELLRGEPEDLTSMEVATFFELVGTLTHQKVLSDTLVWEAFGTWVSSYYLALRSPADRIARTRTDLDDPLIFHEFEWLFNRMIALDRRRLGLAHATLVETDAESRLILSREAALDVS
jgi:hypothetical protein